MKKKERVNGRVIRRRNRDGLGLKPQWVCSWFNGDEIGIGHSHFNENALP